jgi:hypothetical protein
MKWIFNECHLLSLFQIILEPLPVENKDDPQIKLEPLMSAIRAERYTYIKDIHIWDMLMKYDNIATLVSYWEISHQNTLK